VKPRLGRLVLLAVPFAALACSPRLTMEQFELPKHLGLLILTGLVLASGGVRGWRAQPALLGWIAAVTLAAAASVAPAASWLGDYENLEGVLTWAGYAILFLAGTRLGNREAGRFRAAVAAAALLGAAYALLQQAGADPFRGENFRHVRAFAGNPDFLAQQMAMALPLVLARGAGGVLTLGAVGVLTLVLALTASRGGLLGGIAGVAALGWLLRRERSGQDRIAGRRGLRIVAVCLAGVITAEFILPADISLRGRLGALAAGRGLGAARGLMWEGVGRAAREHPLLGSGPDTLGAVFLRTAPPGWADLEGLGTTARKAHDEPLHLLAIAGAAGLGAWLWVLAVAFRRPGRDPAAAAAVVAALAHNLVGFSTAATAPVIWILLGRLSSRSEADRGVSAEAETPKTPVSGILVAIAIALACFGVVRFAADAWAYLGNEANRAGRRELVAPPFLVAARLAPWEPGYPVRAGLALEQAGRLADAIPLFERAVALSPADGIKLGHVGRAAFALASAERNAAGRGEAMEILKKSVELAPSQPSLYGAAIMAAQALGDRAEVDRLLIRLRMREPGWAAKLLGQ